jgi:Ni2+-binding GTPase involved in maturation of urease and hydrogenase
MKVQTEGCVSSGKMSVITKLIKLARTQLKMHFLKCSVRTRRAMIEFLIKLQFKPAALKLSLHFMALAQSLHPPV